MDKRQIILGILTLVLFGCWDTIKMDRNEDEFYSTFGGWDWIRVPLLKPYEAIKTDPELNNPWIVDLQSNKIVHTGPVKKVDVKDSVVYILSGMVDSSDVDSTSFGANMVPTVWFIIDVKQKTENGFLSEREFREFIIKNKYTYPWWYDIDSLSNVLDRGKKLPWRPN